MSEYTVVYAASNDNLGWQLCYGCGEAHRNNEPCEACKKAHLEEKKADWKRQRLEQKINAYLDRRAGYCEFGASDCHLWYPPHEVDGLVEHLCEACAYAVVHTAETWEQKLKEFNRG